MPHTSSEKNVIPRKAMYKLKAVFCLEPMHRLRMLQWWSQSQTQASQDTQWYMLQVLQFSQQMQYSFPFLSNYSLLILARFRMPGLSLIVKRQLTSVTKEYFYSSAVGQGLLQGRPQRNTLQDGKCVDYQHEDEGEGSFFVGEEDRRALVHCEERGVVSQAGIELLVFNRKGVLRKFSCECCFFYWLARLHPYNNYTAAPYAGNGFLAVWPWRIDILRLWIAQQIIRMVDRYQSLLGSEIISDNIDRNMRVDRGFNTNMEMIKRANERAAKMRQYISKYKRDISNEADQHVRQFKEEQREYAKDRNYLKGEVDKLEKGNKKGSSEYNFIKRELIKAVKCELDLQFQLNQEITKRKEEKELLKRQLFEGSVQIQNAVRDIEAKKEDILYLERLINECVQLLEIIGVLVHENGEKINDISREVENANENVERAEKNIDKARIAMQKSRCKWCCVLFIAIVVIVLGVIVYITAVK